MTRTLEQIKQEYANLCVKAGNMTYQIHVLSKDLELLYQSMRDLNTEATTLPKEPELALAPETGVSTNA